MKQMSSFNFKRSLCLSLIITLLMAVFISNLASADQIAGPKTNPVLQYTLNQTYIYHWQSNLNTISHVRRFNPDTSQIEYIDKQNGTRMEATARITTYEIIGSADQYMMAMKVVEPRFFNLDEQGQEVEQIDSEFNAELERPIFFKQNSSGIISEFYVYPGEDDGATNIKKGIASSLHKYLYGETTGITGDPETDSSGTFTPFYTSTNAGGFQNITRNRNQNNYTQFANGASPSEVLGAVTIEDNDLASFNLSAHRMEMVNSNSLIITRGGEDQEITEDGAGVWSESFSDCTLTFVSDEPNTEPFSMTGYINGTLVAFDTADPDEELIPPALAQLGVNSYDINAYDKLVKGLLDKPGEVKQIRDGLQNGTITPLMHHAIIGALCDLGTPQAQDILVQEFILKPGISEQLKGQAIVALGLLKNPTDETISTLEMLSCQPDNKLGSQAVLMLGAAAEKLARTNPARAALIAKNLESSLLSSMQEQYIDLYLGALGNAGFNSSLNAIASYLDDDSPIIRHDAVIALRKISNPEIKTYLLKVLSTETEPAIREAAEDIYKQKKLGDDDLAFVQSDYSWTWNKKIGNGNVYGKLFASLICNRNTGNNFYIYGDGEAKAYAWNWTYSLAKAYAQSDVISGNRRFLAKAYVLGNQVYSTGNIYLTCGQSRSGTLWNQTLTFFNLSYSFYPYGIRVTVGVSASGTVNMTYSVALNACNAPVNVDASISATASGSVQAKVEASVSVYLTKAGITLTVDIFKSTIQAMAEAIVQIISPYFKLHLNASLSMQALSGHLDLWVKVWRLWRGYQTVYSVTLWSFSGYAYNTTLFDHWYYVY